MADREYEKNLGRVATLILLVIAVSTLHYATRTTRPMLHDVYRRLYYLPVGLGAVWFGIRGGLAVAAAVALAYVPHIAFQWQHQERELVNQFMEVALFFLMGGVTGYYADQERRLRVSCQLAAERLDRSYSKLRRQADLILEIEDQMRRADRLSAMGQLAAGMTHEIRNPLGSIKGTAEILRDEFPPGHPKAEFLAILLRETDRLNQVVEDFLGYARHRPGEEGVEEVDLNGLVKETASLMEGQARKVGVSVAVSVPGNVTVLGSAAQLKQVVVNLLLNAIQATPAGSRVTLRTSVRPGRVLGPEYREVDGSLAEVTVEDEGPGISEEVGPRLFEPFFTTKAEGTGLGLAISRRIMEAHGGSIAAENREGARGARFCLCLPVFDRSGGTNGGTLGATIGSALPEREK